MNKQKILDKIEGAPRPSKAKKKIPDDLIVGVGTKRLVVNHPNKNDCVIKFGIGRGIEHNKNEIKIYNNLKKNNSESILCPILNYDSEYRWITTPRLNDIGKVGDQKLYGPKSKKIHKKLENYGFKLYEIETAHYKDDVVAYDYGEIV